MKKQKITEAGVMQSQQPTKGGPRGGGGGAGDEGKNGDAQNGGPAQKSDGSEGKGQVNHDNLYSRQMCVLCLFVHLHIFYEVYF